MIVKSKKMKQIKYSKNKFKKNKEEVVVDAGAAPVAPRLPSRFFTVLGLRDGPPTPKSAHNLGRDLLSRQRSGEAQGGRKNGQKKGGPTILRFFLSNLGLVSSRLAALVQNREIYNLGMVSRPVLLKIKGKSWIFIFLGFTKSKKTKTNSKPQL